MMRPDTSNLQVSKANNILPVMAVFLVGISSVMVAGLKPMLVTLYITHLQLSTSVAGYTLAAEMIAATLGAAAVSFLLRRAKARGLAFIGLIVMCVSDLTSMTIVNLPTLVLVRIVAGFSTGLTAGVMAATIAGMRSPDRLMGAYNTIALLVLAVAFAIVPGLAERFGIGAVFLGLAATTLPALSLIRFFPLGAALRSGVASGSLALPPMPKRETTIALLGTASFYFALGGLWPYMGEIGRQSGLSTGEVARVLGMSQIAAAAGSFVSVLVGQRFGRQIPVWIAVFLASASIIAMQFALTVAGIFEWAAPVFLGGAMMLFGYLMGIISGVDAFGRVAALSFSVQTICFGLGPAWAGALASAAGYSNVLGAALFGMPLTLIFLIPLARSQDNKTGADGVACE